MIAKPIVQIHTEAGGRFRYDAQTGVLQAVRSEFPPPAEGELVEVKTLISHPMETGRRTDHAGKQIPRNIVNTFRARYNGAPVFEADLNTAIAANPYISFYVRVLAGADLSLEWVEDTGDKVSLSMQLPVR